MSLNQIPRIPTAWRQLRVGEMMHSKLPLHRLQAIEEVLRVSGVMVRFDPSPSGYFVVCTDRKEVA